MFSLEFDLSDVQRACEEGQAQRFASARKSVLAAAWDGLHYALDRRRYIDRTWNLTNTARVDPPALGGEAIEAWIFWPMPYASKVDERRGFAGDAYVKAERVVVREVEKGFKELEEVLSR